MTLAAFANVGIGLAFAMLLLLATVGLLIVLIQWISNPRFRRFRFSRILVPALGQAWILHFWFRLSMTESSTRLLEWLFLGSLGMVVTGLMVLLVWFHIDSRPPTDDTT